MRQRATTRRSAHRCRYATLEMVAKPSDSASFSTGRRAPGETFIASADIRSLPRTDKPNDAPTVQAGECVDAGVAGGRRTGDIERSQVARQRGNGAQVLGFPGARVGLARPGPWWDSHQSGCAAPG
jgi:hypothetical protein